jgi:putative ABC transport system permease protein
MLRLALKMLLGDRAKYAMLVGGLGFATLLMMQQSAVFIGLMSWTTSHLRNIRAPIWVGDSKVEQANEVKAMRDTEVNRVRSVPGVEWAVPLYFTILQSRLQDGNFKPVMIVGLDTTTLVGRPALMLKGRLEDVRLPNAVIIDDLAVQRLSAGRAKPLDVGDVFEINDKEARVVGICRAERHFFGYPYIFTTFDQARLFSPKTRKMLSLVLAAPAKGRGVGEVVEAIRAQTGLAAYSEHEFKWATIWWYFRNTGIPMSFGTTILLGFIVGIVISGQTFYLFVIDNLRHLGALKAMGAGNATISLMLLVQALTVGCVGFGLGAGLTALFGFGVLEKGMPPFLLPWQLPAGTFVVIMLICMFAALLGIVRIYKVEPAMVFRG